MLQGRPGIPRNDAETSVHTHAYTCLEYEQSTIHHNATTMTSGMSERTLSDRNDIFEINIPSIWIIYLFIYLLCVYRPRIRVRFLNKISGEQNCRWPGPWNALFRRVACARVFHKLPVRSESEIHRYDIKTREYVFEIN